MAMYHWVTTTHRTVSKVVPAEEMVLAVAAKVTVASRAVVAVVPSLSHL